MWAAERRQLSQTRETADSWMKDSHGRAAVYITKLDENKTANAFQCLLMHLMMDLLISHLILLITSGASESNYS